MVVIRLARSGAKKRPFYHVVAADRRSPRDGRNIEDLGYFNPIAKGQEKRLHINIERIEYWVSKGAQPSERVASLLKQAKKLAATEPQQAEIAAKNKKISKVKEPESFEVEEVEVEVEAEENHSEKPAKEKKSNTTGKTAKARTTTTVKKASRGAASAKKPKPAPTKQSNEETSVKE